MSEADLKTTKRMDGVVLGPGEFFRKVHFGAGTVNRGAVLMECEWDGGSFEAGVMLGGFFRSGDVLGGDFWGVIFWGGRWLGGTWLGGFDRTGGYRPRGERPPQDDRARGTGAQHLKTPPAGRGQAHPTVARRLIIASPHRYPDLARLWYRSVARDLVPAFERAGLEVDVVIYRDAHAEEFVPAWFPGARLEAPRPGARDFIEFYDAMLAVDCDYLFFLDADVFLLDGPWTASHLLLFEDPDLAAISFMNRPDRVAPVYALLCRRSAYLELSPPVLACRYERMEDWPRSVHRDPADQAAIRLQARGRRLVRADEEALKSRLAGFEGTTNLRASREIFGRIIGAERFEALIAEHRYFVQAACDNALLGALYQALFGEPFAPGDEGSALGGSLTIAAIHRALDRFRNASDQAALRGRLDRSEHAIALLAARESIALVPPPLRREGWPRGPAGP